ncbi:glycosyltransferase family 1 protein [Desulfitobacterium dichloroeliminans]|uniref:glycosyltransferase family 1 protein n=1 Tax=Desulfitobacterium dichloroeliminans TaxID=233055 RepID=UPI001FA79E61|nr:glycosyltransferase family 1 protein [Desulfitobacterium dichloroeliminans]
MAQIVGKVLLSGVDVIVMEYYRNIDRSRIQFDFIMDGDNETPIDQEIKELGGRVYKVDPYEHNIKKNMKQCYEILRENQYSIVHAHLNTLSVFPLYEAWRAKIPVRIAHNHSTAANGEVKKTVMKYMLKPFAKKFATHYSACSTVAGRWLFGDYSYDSGEVKLVNNAINIEKFSFNKQVRDRIRNDLNLKEKLVIGHVGRFVYQKNHAFLIDIFYEIHKRNKNTILMLIGSGGLEQSIKEKVATLRLTDSVLFLGLREDVSELMQAMDVFVFPSHYEGLGMVVIEAQAAGLRTIVSEAIPEEAKLTDLFEYCSLSQPARYWAEIVLNCYDGNERRQRNNELRQSGYDIVTAADELREWYEWLYKNVRVHSNS